MTYLTIGLAGSAALVLLIAYVWLVRLAFREGFWWGMGVAFVPLVPFVFLSYKWPLGRGPLIAASFGGFMLLVAYPNAKTHLDEVRSLARASVIAIPSSTPAVITQEYLTKRQMALKATEKRLLAEKAATSAHDLNSIRRLRVQIDDYNRSLVQYQELVTKFRTETARSAQPTQPAVAVAPGAWTLDLSSIAFPTSPVAGDMDGGRFEPKQIRLEGGNLVFRATDKDKGEREMLIMLGVSDVETLQGRVYSIRPELRHGVPEIQTRAKASGKAFADSKVHQRAYAMRLEFAKADPGTGKLAGRIYLCLPNPAQGVVAGTFEADIVR